MEKYRLRTMLLCCVLAGLSACMSKATKTERMEENERVPMALTEQFQLMKSWFGGEYDNYEQVWLEKETDVKNIHEHIHHVFAPVSTPKIGKDTFFIKQYRDADPSKVYRQRLYRFAPNEKENAIQLTIYSFKEEKKYADAHLSPEKLAELSMEELRTIPGCEVFWKFNGEYFDGFMKEKACHFESRRSGKEIYITDDLRLTDNSIWIRDVAHDQDGNYVFGNKDGIHHKNRKVKYFTGWAGVKAKGITATKEDKDWHFMSGLSLHNEGQIVALKNGKTGKETGYSIQLAQLTYQNTKTPILKLGLIDNESGKTIRYIWANTDAEKIGLNLGWVQVGLTRKESDIAFGYDKN